jgi:hypothetical protein
VSSVYRERKKKILCGSCLGWKKIIIIIIMFFNDLMGYIRWLLKFWDLPNLGGIKQLLKWLYRWAGPGTIK